MGIFFRLFDLFKRNKPHKQFLGLYSKLNELVFYIKKEAKALKKLQEELNGFIKEFAGDFELRGKIEKIKIYSITLDQN